MLEQRYRWKNKQLRDHVAVINGDKSPSIVLKNARFLHSTLRRWIQGNIWIENDRIVYVGDKLPQKLSGCEVVNCENCTLVPGYIEPHVHPFQLYNPQSFGEYASQTGTTSFISDNLMLFLFLKNEKAFSLMNELNKLPFSLFWWCRYDPMTELNIEDEKFSHSDIKSWIESDFVVQGGELTSWPKLLDGDDMILHWIQETKRIGKRIEGHFPGASEKTLVKMALLGADGDHESMNGKDVYKRLMQGYMVALRHSSIRPDLEILLSEIQEMGLDQYDQMMFTTDGSFPSFYENGVIDRMIAKALEFGIPEIDAYHMASYNIAKYYRIDHFYGIIAPGRVANINFLESENNPTPLSVLSKGQWLKKNGTKVYHANPIKWENWGLKPVSLRWDIKKEDLQFSMPFGIQMVNAVITKPYSLKRDIGLDQLPEDDESFLLLLDRNGRWRVSTALKGFANRVQGLASSFSTTGDILLIGKSKEEMIRAFQRMKELGGGIVLAEHGEVIYEIPLTLSGIMSDQNMEELIKEEKTMKNLLIERGYSFSDPFYTLLFLSATHLPYIRVTSCGIYDVMKKTILFPTIMR
jgi:adenine deaminase